MQIDNWKSQIMRGTLEYCVLLMLKQKTYYGYEILQALSQYPILTSTESTIYPLLRRLQKDGYLSSFWQESIEGLPPRKYYTLTKQGLDYLHALEQEWQSLLSTISLLKGETSDEHNI